MVYSLDLLWITRTTMWWQNLNIGLIVIYRFQYCRFIRRRVGKALSFTGGLSYVDFNRVRSVWIFIQGPCQVKWPGWNTSALIANLAIKVVIIKPYINDILTVLADGSKVTWLAPLSWARCVRAPVKLLILLVSEITGIDLSKIWREPKYWWARVTIHVTDGIISVS